MYIDGTTLVKLRAFLPHRHVKKKKKEEGYCFPLLFLQMFQIQIQNTEKVMQILVSVKDPTPFLQCFNLIIKNFLFWCSGSTESFCHLINGLLEAEVFLSLAHRCFPQWTNHGIQWWVFHCDLCKKKCKFVVFLLHCKASWSQWCILERQQ